MIKKIRQFIAESEINDIKDSEKCLLYYGFDWDDNILRMPTKILISKRDGNDWIETQVSTAQFAEVRSDVENWKIDFSKAFDEFRDNGPRGDRAFIEDVKSAISQRRFAPAWNDFIECLTSGSLFAIITARGHESETMRKGVEWIIDNILSENQLYAMYNNLLKFNYLFKEVNNEVDYFIKGVPCQNGLIKKYLDHCDFVGVSALSRGGSPANPEKAKEDVFLEFVRKVNMFASRIGWKAKVGFSDDDSKNVKHIEDVIDDLHHEKFSEIIQYTVKGTKDPENITKKIFSPILTETSHQTPGLESSVLKFTQFGNMTGQLNPQGPIDRQDDFANQMKRQTKYLTKTSKEILGNKTKKKKKKSSK